MWLMRDEAILELQPRLLLASLLCSEVWGLRETAGEEREREREAWRSSWVF